MKIFGKDLKKMNFPVIIIASCVVLQLISIHSYLLFHSLIEIFSVIIAFCVFIVTWHSRNFVNNTFLLVLGISYFFVGYFGLFHTLSYKGMNIFVSDTVDLPTQLWIVARYLEAISFIVALLFLKKKTHYDKDRVRVKSELIFFIYFILLVIISLSIFYWDIFPVTYIDGIGLTSFKVVSEYIISFLFFISLILIIGKRNFLDSKIFSLLSLFLILKIFTEILFSGYVEVYDLRNMIGHLFEYISYLLVYKAVLDIGLMQPYRLLFMDLKRSQDDYRATQDELQQRIKDHLTDAYNHIGITNRKISLLLEIEKHSQYKKNKQKLLMYIAKTAKNSCHAKIALVYKCENNDKFTLIFGDGTKKEILKDLKIVDKDRAPFLKSLLDSKNRINYRYDDLDDDCFKTSEKLSYFVAIPFVEERVCKGFLYVGFKNRKSMESQELEFLDVYAIHIAKALSKLNIIEQNT